MYCPSAQLPNSSIQQTTTHLVWFLVLFSSETGWLFMKFLYFFIFVYLDAAKQVFLLVYMSGTPNILSNFTNVSIVIVKRLIKLQNLLELIKARLSDCSKIISKDNMENEELLQHLMTTCRKVFEKHRIPLTILTWKHHPTLQRWSLNQGGCILYRVCKRQDLWPLACSNHQNWRGNRIIHIQKEMSTHTMKQLSQSGWVQFLKKV